VLRLPSVTTLEDGHAGEHCHFGRPEFFLALSRSPNLSFHVIPNKLYAMMTFFEAVKCSRVVYFEVSEGFEHASEYRYYRRGSSFICQFEERHYIVTAEHVIKDSDNLTRIFMISEKDEETILVPDCSLFIKGKDADFKDVRVFRVATDVENTSWQEDAIPVTKNTINAGRKKLQSSGELYVSGFPGEGQEIKHNKKELRQERVGRWGKYDRETADYKHRMRLSPDQGIDDMGGFSGSPVLCKSETGFGLSGIAIQAGSTGIQFVDSAVLWNIFDKNKCKA